MLLTTYQTLAGIGGQLGIARPTVKTHVQNIYKKLGATKRAEAVKLAESAGLLPAGAAPMTGKDRRDGQLEIDRETGGLDRSSAHRGRVRR